MNMSWKFECYRTRIKKNIKPPFSCFLYRFLGVCIWNFGLGKVRGHKKKMIYFLYMVLYIKKNFIGPKNYGIKEHFLLKDLISTIIYYSSIDLWNSWVQFRNLYVTLYAVEIIVISRINRLYQGKAAILYINSTRHLHF